MTKIIVCFLLLIPFALLPKDDENNNIRSSDNSTKVHIETTDVKSDSNSITKRNIKIKELLEIIKYRPENPQKAEYYRQLAELYWEQAVSERSPEKSQIWFKKTIEICDYIINKYPAFPKMDDVYFFKAYNLMKTGRNAEALKYYTIIVEKFPNSKFISNSYYEIGEYYYNNDITAAVPNYKAIVEKYPDSKIYGFALYKYAWGMYHLDHSEDSVKFFQKAYEVATKIDNQSLKYDAARDIVTPYAEVGSADNAASYFKTFVKEQKYFIFVLERLVSTYFEQGKCEEALLIYKKLQQEDPNRQNIWQKQISECRKQLETTM